MLRDSADAWLTTTSTFAAFWPYTSVATPNNVAQAFQPVWFLFARDLVNPAHARIPMPYHFTATNVTHTGVGASSTCPVGVRRPVAPSIRNTTMLSEF